MIRIELLVIYDWIVHPHLGICVRHWSIEIIWEAVSARGRDSFGAYAKRFWVQCADIKYIMMCVLDVLAKRYGNTMNNLSELYWFDYFMVRGSLWPIELWHNVSMYTCVWWVRDFCSANQFIHNTPSDWENRFPDVGQSKLTSGIPYRCEHSHGRKNSLSNWNNN